MDRWVVITEMKPSHPKDDGMMTAVRKTRQRAESYGLGVACLDTTVRVEVYAPDGTLEYLYDKTVQPAWLPMSEEAQQLHERQLKMLFE